jgi:hypothetical protein
MLEISDPSQLNVVSPQSPQDSSEEDGEGSIKDPYLQ